METKLLGHFSQFAKRACVGIGSFVLALHFCILSAGQNRPSGAIDKAALIALPDDRFIFAARAILTYKTNLTAELVEAVGIRAESIATYDEYNQANNKLRARVNYLFQNFVMPNEPSEFNPGRPPTKKIPDPPAPLTQGELRLQYFKWKVAMEVNMLFHNTLNSIQDSKPSLDALNLLLTKAGFKSRAIYNPTALDYSKSINGYNKTSENYFEDIRFARWFFGYTQHRITDAIRSATSETDVFEAVFTKNMASLRGNNYGEDAVFETESIVKVMIQAANENLRRSKSQFPLLLTRVQEMNKNLEITSCVGLFY